MTISQLWLHRILKLPLFFVFLLFLKAIIQQKIQHESNLIDNIEELARRHIIESFAKFQVSELFPYVGAFCA